MHVFVIIVTALLMLAGLAGAVLPVIPGPALVLAGALLYGWYGDFAVITWTALAVLAVLTGLSFVLDYAASIIGARAFGSGRWGIIGSCIGACAGFVVANVAGAVIGMIAGACLFELARGRDLRSSLKIGCGTLVGFLAGTVGKVLLTLAMIVIVVLQLV
ncbi:MAG: DUF456 domain-containing protein [Deltaproteobacteria bacterium]|nr:DUF456 domain-containing protein [Deltaproteobacteria bacterium]